MRQAKAQDRERILEYLKKDIVNCIYMYIDITNYGVKSENMAVWLQEQDEQIELAVMKYYDSYQIYSHRTDVDLSELCRLLREDPVAMISARKELIERLDGELPGYRATYGVIFHAYTYGEERDNTYDLRYASEEDAPDIAKLLCEDKGFGAHYTVEGLSAQLAERIHNGTGCSFIARDDKGELIAHVASFAETKDVVVISGAIVRPEYRKTDVYEQLENFMGCYYVAQEHKEVYAFAYEKRIIHLQAMYGAICGECGKLEKIR